MTTQKIWVVEMCNERNNEYEPTVGAALTKEYAQVKKREWKDRNPYDKFRVTKYVRAKP